ncbi:SirB2 family protein [Oceanospirillum sanctuarii]|uniref:SirB2 family protein n=1 Tax=Oceanospirillum sanctuarii TaxID=1434821 RepID=UPI000A36B443|nr:SirB2 family protein [Oceanospirillum sanctuarii]
MYAAFKHIHLLTVALSLGLFTLRGIWMLLDSDKLQKRWVKIVPHIIDTLLLVSAIGLMFQIHQYPFADGWLTAKLLGLIAYIVLGTIALKRGKTKGTRVIALVAAFAVIAYIVGVAIRHNALSWLA